MSSAAYWKVLNTTTKSFYSELRVSKANEKKLNQNLWMVFKWLVTKHKHTYAQSTLRNL